MLPGPASTHTMHINDIDLNLLRLFDAIYRARSVSCLLYNLTLPTKA